MSYLSTWLMVIEVNLIYLILMCGKTVSKPVISIEIVVLFDVID
jgi:hypothetical protein